MSAPKWVDIVSSLVTLVRADSDNPCSGDAPYYMHGHPLEIVDRLAQKENHPTQKFNRYPLIVLMQDFPETVGEDMLNRSSVSLNILICVETQQDYSSTQRYSETFTPYLYPLYDLLIEKIISSGYFRDVAPGLVPHTKTDRLFWGRSGLYGREGNIFNDRIDAIEIEDLTLNLRNHYQLCNT